MKSKLDIDARGFAHPPRVPGLGVELDWDFIDKCTVMKL
jgi:L-alanine-DL-glutamate epimerase-like enolase superfamily enzyme